MYEVLLVDDEKNSREHLGQVIPFERHGFAVRGTAGNGREALDLILGGWTPDLVLLDIHMPVMDGLAFLSHLRAAGHEDVRVVMVSGFGEFEYARQAMKHGVKAYLTKPVDEDELLPLLDELRAELDERQRLREADLGRESQAAFRRLYNGAPVERSLFEGFAVLTCVLADALGETTGMRADQHVQTLVSNMIGPEYGIPFRTKGSQQSYLVPPQALARHGGHCPGLAQALRRSMESAGLDCALLFDTAALSTCRESFREDFQTHLYDMLTGVFYDGSRILCCDGSRCPDGGEPQDEAKRIDALAQGVHALDAQAVLGRMDAQLGAMRRERVGIQYIQQFGFRLYYLLMDELARAGGAGEESPLTRPDLMSPPVFMSYDTWRRQLAGMVSDAFCRLHRDAHRENPSVAVAVMRHVDAHFAEPLSLKGMADAHYVNAAYLGRVFQKVAGMPFKEYLNRIRVNEAKRLLRRTDLMVYEIAARVGFAESSYFIVKFMQEVGQSPSEYRNGRAGTPMQPGTV